MTAWFFVTKGENTFNPSHFLPRLHPVGMLVRGNTILSTESQKFSAFRSEGVPHVASILVLHGPNLNLLGSREPETYGDVTLEQINEGLLDQARDRGHHLQTLQSNAEYELIERIQNAPGEGIDFIIFNPAAFTHTSIALRDALLATGVPFIEVHLSNIHRREAFRQHSYFSDIAAGVILGLGADGYRLALDAAMHQLDKS